MSGRRDIMETSFQKGRGMQVHTQFSVYLINKPGVLASVTGALAKQKVNILALALMDSGEHGALRLVCDDADGARKVLGKTHDRWTECEVAVLELDNRPGAFANVAKRLSDEHVNITYAYCSAGAPGGRTTAVFKVAPEDLKKVGKLLEDRSEGKKSRPVKRKPGV
ncbi:MAG: ACT domain-containing protein [Phycisphaerae bacterium]